MKTWYFSECPYPALPNGGQILTALRAIGYRDVYGNSPPNLPEYTATLALSQVAPFVIAPTGAFGT